jgi:CRP/FNR family transcriptional regulator, cyclic AMP receptor protein
MVNLKSRNEEKDPSNRLLACISSGKRVLNLRKNETVFSQGDPADAVYYIHQGQVKLAVVSFGGKEATLTLLGPGDFLGVCCLGGQSERSNTASALEPSVLTRIERESMLKSLREQPQLLDVFLAYLLKRTLNLQKDLCTQILDPSEKRLARVLLRLSELNEHEEEECVRMPKISHDTLATMVGTTRSRVTYFMNKFKNQGLINYDKGIMVRPSQLSMMLQEDF